MIRNQVKLPLSVALNVVLQGIRIRFGRSLVTLMGVALGIAFLMSALAGQVLTKGVSREENLRLEVQRRYSFLAAETGPVRDRVLGVVQVGPLDETESRLLARLAADGVARFQWAACVAPPPSAVKNGRQTFGHTPAPPRAAVPQSPGRVAMAGATVVPVGLGLNAVAADASAVLVLGAGPVPAADWPAVLQAARQKVVALSRSDQRLAAAPGFSVATLERQPKEDEVRRQAEELGRQRFRAAWVVVLSLLVTVISIANAMLMSVTERFKEIGTMKCLGALSSFIRRIFLIESALIGVVGSVIGLVVGILFTLVMYAAAYGVPLALASMDPGWIALYAAVSLVAGLVLSIVAAIYPASVASRMVPATALRSSI